MEFELSDIGAAVRVALHGRLDAPSVERIETRLLSGIASNGKHAVVDLTDVSFVSSLGIRMLLSATEALRLKQASLVLYGARPLVAESLNLVVKQLIPLVERESQALELLAARNADRG